MKIYKAVIIIILSAYSICAHCQENDRKIVFQSLAWSPDGAQIAFTVIKIKPDWSDYSPFKWKLFIYNIKNETKELLDSGCLFVSFSPDGKKLAFDKSVGNNSDLFFIDLTTHKIIKVAGTNAKDRAPDWSADGKMMVFYSNQSGHEELYTCDLRGGGIRKITDNPTIKSFNPVWASGSGKIVYYIENGNNDSQICVTDSDGTNQKILTNDKYHNIYPSWTSDNKIIYIRAMGEIMIMNSDGSGLHRLTDKTGIQVRMSPDRKFILIAKRDGNLYVLNLHDNSESIVLSGDDLM